MKLNDSLKLPSRGYFKIESLDKNGNIVDQFENHNLITDAARVNFSHLIAGISSVDRVINSFRMGTEGHKDGDILVPKDESTGVTSSITNLFCGTDPNKKGTTWDEIKFTPSGIISQTSAVNVYDGANNNSTVNINVSDDTSNPYVTYTFLISHDAFNGPLDGVKYTECGLFAGNKMIAYKAFKGKIKESQVSIRITWTLIF